MFKQRYLEPSGIVKEDCRVLCKVIEPKTIDLVITSPPYNLDMKYDIYKDNNNYMNYLRFLYSCFKEVYTVLKDDGRVCLNIADLKNGSLPLHYDVFNIMRKIGYKCYTTIVWYRQQIGNRISWGSYMSPSCPSFPTPFEYILVFYKNEKKHVGDKGSITVTADEFKTNSISMWDFPPETKAKKLGHPCPFPEELPYRCMQQFSYIDDIVFDPFCGVGTTCIVAKRLGRKYFGCDVSQQYVDLALERIGND